MRKGSASSSLIYSVISFGSFNPFCFITTLSTIPILLILAKTSSTLELRSNEKVMEVLFSLPAEITIFPLVLAVLGTMHAKPRKATIMVFRGRRVNPNSIFCKDH